MNPLLMPQDTPASTQPEALHRKRTALILAGACGSLLLLAFILGGSPGAPAAKQQEKDFVIAPIHPDPVHPIDSGSAPEGWYDGMEGTGEERTPAPVPSLPPASDRREVSAATVAANTPAPRVSAPVHAAAPQASAGRGRRLAAGKSGGARSTSTETSVLAQTDGSHAARPVAGGRQSSREDGRRASRGERHPFGLVAAQEVPSFTPEGIPLRTDLRAGVSALEKTGADKPLWKRPESLTE
ncbi:hypothetical protein [Prosthecobacter sp.]|uniref:hypothetical protein n=1 Tax=Prosthecobacter sp. TaxID=1965333 RepID=UPI003784974B